MDSASELHGILWTLARSMIDPIILADGIAIYHWDSLIITNRRSRYFSKLAAAKPNRDWVCCELSILTPRNILDLAVLSVLIFIFIYFAFMYSVWMVTHRCRTEENLSPWIFHCCCVLSFHILLLSFTDADRITEQRQQWLWFGKLTLMSAYFHCLVLFSQSVCFSELFWSQLCVVNI